MLLSLLLAAVAGVAVGRVWGRVTHRRRLLGEARARRAQRLSEMADMTRGLAHEIKNPLSTVGLNVQLLQEDLEDLAHEAAASHEATGRIERMRRRLASLRGETGRLRDVLDDFLRFAGRVELDRQATDVNELIAELVDFFEPQAQSASIRVVTVLRARPAVAEVDGPLVKQAVLNLLLNAVQAMEAGRMKDQPHAGADTLRVETLRREGSRRAELAIRVVDTGPGIGPDALPRLFEPYYSTKREGTGLGLPTARRIAEEHGGTLSVESTPGGGASFELALPV